MAVSVWIFGDLPLGHAAGPSYMVESWQRELTGLGLVARTFTPASTLRGQRRDLDRVEFGSLRHVGYPGDYHARYSVLAELIRARRELPDVIVVSTLGRVGALGLTLAAFYSIPLVMVVSTDTTGATAYYSTIRAICSGGVKPAFLLLVSAQVRAAFFSRSWRRLGRGRRTGWLASHVTAALYAQAREIVLLSPKGLATYGDAGRDANVTVFPAGIDRLPAAQVPVELAWRPGALRVLYVGRFAPEKSLSVLLEGLRLALDAGVDAHLALVGEGPLREHLLEQGADLGLGDRLTVIGPYPRGQLGGIYASADVFAFPSVVDTQAFVLNEAAHEGLALLVSDTANSVVDDGVSALVVPSEPAHYARALAQLEDRQLRDRLGGAARQRAELVGETAQCARLAEVIRRAARPSAARRADATGTSIRDDLIATMLVASVDAEVSGAAPTR